VDHLYHTALEAADRMTLMIFSSVRFAACTKGEYFLRSLGRHDLKIATSSMVHTTPGGRGQNDLELPLIFCCTYEKKIIIYAHQPTQPF